MISHTSTTGSPIRFAKMILRTNTNGIVNTNVIPKENILLFFPASTNTATMSHINIIEAADAAAPTENTSFTLTKRLIKNK